MARKMLACRLPDSWHARAQTAFEKSGIETVSEWLGGLVKAEVVRVEAAELSVSPGEPDVPAEIKLVAAQSKIEGMEALIGSHRDRFAEAQAHILDLKSENENLHERLAESHGNVERITLMLPSVQDGAEVGPRRWWRFRWG